MFGWAATKPNIPKTLDKNPLKGIRRLHINQISATLSTQKKAFTMDGGAAGDMTGVDAWYTRL